MTADTGFRARHASSFERVAVVSDEDWMRPALRALSFMLPGKAKGFRVKDLPDAKTWLARTAKLTVWPPPAGVAVTGAERSSSQAGSGPAAGDGDVRAGRRHVADERVDLGRRRRT